MLTNFACLVVDFLDIYIFLLYCICFPDSGRNGARPSSPVNDEVFEEVNETPSEVAEQDGQRPTNNQRNTALVNKINMQQAIVNYLKVIYYLLEPLL